MEEKPPDRLSTVDQLNDVLDKMTEIAHKATLNNYIFRGESRCNQQVSSTLYRKYADIYEAGFDISIVQEEMLQAAKDFIGQSGDNNDVLAQLQHYGSRTNLIDFTTDYVIALFFACDGHADEDGRVLFLNKTTYPLLQPRNPVHRVIAQKSIFVQPPKGFVEPSDIVVVPAALKTAVLDHLRTSHGVSISTIYNDLHGFIRYESTHESAYAEFYTGVTHHGKKELQTALEHYNKSIELNPHIAATYQNRGAVYAEKRDYELAMDDFNKSIELNPHIAVTYGSRGAVYAEKRDYELAMEDFNKAIELDPHSVLAYYSRGIMLREKADYDDAIVDLNKAIELDPNYSSAYCGLGNAYRGIGNDGLAMQNYDRAVELDPKSAMAYANRGTIYTDKGDHDRAMHDYNKAIELDSTHAAAYSNRGATYWNKDDFNRAIRDYERAIELDPNSILAYYNRSEYWLSVGDWEKAEADLSKAWELGYDVASAFSRNFACVSNFERKFGVKLPSRVARLLRCLD